MFNETRGSVSAFFLTRIGTIKKVSCSPFFVHLLKDGLRSFAAVIVLSLYR